MTIPQKTKLTLYSSLMLANLLNLVVVSGCWGLTLVLPHFQPSPGVFGLLLDSLVVLILFIFCKRLINSRLDTSKILKSCFILISFGGFLVGVFILALGNSPIYDFWSHLGSGTMKLDGRVFLFGDLMHLTAAAGCPEPIIIGRNICDPWGRLFNQNPQLGELFRLLHVTNIYFFGLLLVAFFVISVLFAIHFLKVKSIGIYALMCTPVVVLAVDRGNELLTISLIMVGLYTIRISKLASQSFGALALGAACFFKLWPLFLVLFLVMFQSRRIKTIPKIILGLSILYWLAKIPVIMEIMKATQSGSPYGVSFGLKLFISPHLTLTRIIFLIILTFLFTYFLIIAGGKSLAVFLESRDGSVLFPWVVPIMLTYAAIWATGDNYIYRMVILIPLVLILSARGIDEFQWPKFVITATLVTAITSRLAVTTAISSALALYFLYVAFYAWRNRIQSIN